ncbi:MAG: SCP2 sterol-binding domain-containing protein [Desulfobacterales bacterium]
MDTITGTGGGEYTVCVDDGKVRVKEGLHDPNVATTVSAKDWIAITLGKLDGMTAFSSRKTESLAIWAFLTKATQFFKKYTLRPPRRKSRWPTSSFMESQQPEGVAGVTANYGYKITGTGGGEYTVCVDDGKVQSKKACMIPTSPPQSRPRTGLLSPSANWTA